MIFLSIIAAIQCVFLILMLLRFGYAKSANRTLILLLITIAISLATDSLLASTPFIKWPQLSMLLLPWDLVIGPLLLFYFQQMLRSKSRIRWRVLHLTPALGLMFIGALIAILIPADVWQSIYSEDHAVAPQFDLALLLVQCHVGIYLSLCLREWLNYQDCTHRFFSSVDGIELSWLRRMLWIFGLMWLVWLVTTLLAEKLPEQNYLEFAFPFGVYILAYNALIYRNVILPEQIPLINTAREQQENANKTSYQRAKLSPLRREILQQALADTMQRDLPFLDPALNLAGLSAAIGASSHELSQLLNEVLNENFYDYINRLRTQEVQRCLRDPAYTTQSILDIALHSGFNSKAAFNAAFKRFTASTPSQYRKGNLVNCQ